MYCVIAILPRCCGGSSLLQENGITLGCSLMLGAGLDQICIVGDFIVLLGAIGPMCLGNVSMRFE